MFEPFVITFASIFAIVAFWLVAEVQYRLRCSALGVPHIPLWVLALIGVSNLLDDIKAAARSFISRFRNGE